jgi:hypothetical protein
MAAKVNMATEEYMLIMAPKANMVTVVSKMLMGPINQGNHGNKGKHDNKYNNVNLRLG